MFNYPEIVILFFSINVGISTTIAPAFLKSRIKLDLSNRISVICNGTVNCDTLESIVVSRLAYFGTYLQICSTIPAFFVSFFIGIYSDKKGRKGPLMVSLMGSVINNFMLLLVASLPYVPTWFILIGALISGFTGHIISVFTNCFCMLSDSAKSSDQLTLRLGLGSGLISFGLVSGTLVAGLMLRIVNHENFLYTYLITISCSSFTFLYVTCFLKETLQSNGNADGINSKAENNKEKRNLLWKLIKETFLVMTKRRHGHKRICLNICVAVLLIVVACDDGKYSTICIYKN